jgi:hypothetical protein
MSLCECGCGGEAPIATRSYGHKGIRKGDSLRFINGHNVNILRPAPKPIVERFWPKVDKNGAIPSHRPDLGPCWTWKADCGARRGYGRLLLKGIKRDLAHRLAWKLTYGEIPAGLFVCHKCDVPNCVNPHHLFLATNEENTRDRHRKGRSARAERIHRTVLTTEIVESIRKELADGSMSKDLAAKYNVTKSAIQHIKMRRCWRHVA